MNKYRIKVIEQHIDYVCIVAASPREAAKRAIEYSQCEFDCVYDTEIILTEETSDPETP